MKPIRQFRPILFTTLVLALLASAAVAGLSASQTEPEAGATLSRPPTTLRVWFSEAPEVDKSELTLEGPTETMDLEGLHTMGADDLMVRIVGKVVRHGKCGGRRRSSDAAIACSRCGFLNSPG